MHKRSIVVMAIVWMVVLVAGISSAVTMALCGVFDPGREVRGSAGDQASQDEYRMIERYRRLDEVRTELTNNYYVKLDEDELTLGAVRGMLASVGDPYTFYYSPDEIVKMNQHTQGYYEGVGVLLSSDKEGQVVVLRVFEKTPADEAGVLAGDVITEVNGQAVTAKTSKDLSEAIGAIRSAEAKDGLIFLTIHRGGEILTIGVGSATIEVTRVEHEMLPGNVGYIVIYEFMGDDATAFHAAVKALKAAGATKLILDLRSNPGGLLTDVVAIADELMGEGLIVYTEDRYGRRKEYFSDAEKWDVPIAVLVNGMSASASEILAGALQDTGRAKVVGETTFGKGIVQTVIPFREDGAGMQLTTALYYTPSGKSIHGVGIVPDKVVPLDGENYTTYSGANLAGDSQLRAAYDLLTEMASCA
ncbi:MAG: S41 family peptidase [Clostridia bacterium]